MMGGHAYGENTQETKTTNTSSTRTDINTNSFNTTDSYNPTQSYNTAHLTENNTENNNTTNESNSRNTVTQYFNSNNQGISAADANDIFSTLGLFESRAVRQLGEDQANALNALQNVVLNSQAQAAGNPITVVSPPASGNPTPRSSDIDINQLILAAAISAVVGVILK